MSFTTFPANVSDEILREWVYEWIDLLAAGEFDKAAVQLYPEVIPNNGSISAVKYPVWTGELMERVIGYGGIPEPVTPDDPRFARVIPIENSFREEFERRFTIDHRTYEIFPKKYLGDIHLDLPLELGSFRGVGDLTAQFRLKDLGDGQLAIVLEDIHIL
ncbi:MAG: hypothetical protein QM758_18420 [Armatimonas sp.]